MLSAKKRFGAFGVFTNKPIEGRLYFEKEKFKHFFKFKIKGGIDSFKEGCL